MANKQRGIEDAPRKVQYVMRFFPVGEDINATNFILAKNIVAQHAHAQEQGAANTYYEGVIEGLQRCVLTNEGYSVGLRS